MDIQLYNGDHKELCDVCLGKGLLLCCDYCSSAYHPECVNPPVLHQPEDFWMCPHCIQNLLSCNGKECNELHCKESVSSNSQDIEYSTFDNKNERSERVHIKGENGNKKGHIFTSGFRGVYSRGDKWNAQIQYNGKKVYLGSYSSEEEAAHAYDLAAKRYHGNKAILNFHNDESGCIRNPFQVNSKPTSKKNSHLSLSNDYAEVNMETIPSESRQQSIQENSLSFYDSFSNHSTSSNHKVSPIVFTDIEECKSLLLANRSDILSNL